MLLLYHLLIFAFCELSTSSPCRSLLFLVLSSPLAVNADAINDSMPTPAVFMSHQQQQKRGSTTLQQQQQPNHRLLMEAVVQQANNNQKKKRRKTEDGDDTNTETLEVDWDAVAETVGNGATASECERQFLALPLDEEEETERREGSITPDPAVLEQGAQERLLRRLVDQADPTVLRQVTQAALAAHPAAARPREAASAAAVGLVARAAIEQARSQEDGVAHLLAALVDLRMQKLENRLAMLDDVEGMLDAERLALELERRDLYTARCRHWFGGT